MKMLTFKSATLVASANDALLQATFTADTPINPVSEPVSLSIAPWNGSPSPFTKPFPGLWTFGGSFPDGSHGTVRFRLQPDGSYVMVANVTKNGLGVSSPAAISLSIGAQSGSTTA